jgi:cytoskeletal protein RodZ
MTESTSSFMAILFGLGVFAVIVAVGWRSVQNRRIIRLAGADGQETIILADEGDQISSVETTTTETTQAAPAPAPTVVVVNNGVEEPASVADPALDAEAEVAGHDRLARVVSATK